MRPFLADEIETVELQILRLLALREGLFEVAARAEEHPGEAAEFGEGTLARCVELAREHDLDPRLAVLLVPGTCQVPTGAPAGPGPPTRRDYPSSSPPFRHGSSPRSHNELEDPSGPPATPG